LRQANSANAIAGFTSLLTRRVDMGETFTSQELEQFFALASEANQLGVRARTEIEDLRIRQEQLSGYAYSETASLAEEVGKLSELVGLMFNILGVPIRDPEGRLRDVNDASHDLRSLNPKIVLTFQELMQF